MGIKIRRLLAISIDYFIIFNISYRIPYYLYSLFSNKFVNVLMGILSLLLFVILFLRKDLLFKNASFGKVALGIKIVDDKNKDVKNKEIIIKRNLTTLLKFPLYPFNVLINNLSVGDQKFKTKIIKFK